jgi:hypothetical protein
MARPLFLRREARQPGTHRHRPVKIGEKHVALRFGKEPESKRFLNGTRGLLGEQYGWGAGAQ